MPSQDAMNSLYDYFRTVFREVTDDDIVDHENAYRGSDEERHDLLQLYARFKGDMKKVYSWLMCSRPEIDSHRFRDAIRAAIGDETSGIEEYKMFTKWAAKVDKTPVPSQDPLKPSKKKKTKSGGGDGSDTSALALAILGNRKKRQDDFMSRLEAKYGGVGKSSAAGLGVGGQSMKKKKSKKK